VAEAQPKSKAVTKIAKVEAAKPTGKTDIATDSEGDDEDDDDEDEDDQTEALLKGFESDGDDEDALNEEGMPEGQSVPERKQLTKAEEKKLKKIADSGASDKPGVVYVGRIPHGFFEHEMKAYFKQFGNILNLRLSRNKKNGASKHYGWIQFESTTVADIVARTMDNYLMFSHILKVKLVPDEQVPENLFKGANKRFKKVPWNKLQGRKIAQGASEEVWDGRVEREEKRRDEKAKKLQAIGYDFEAPTLKSAKGVSKKNVAAIEPATDKETVVAIEAAPTTEESSKSKKKTKKPAKSKVVVDEEMTEDKVEAEPEELVKKKKEHKAMTAAPTTEDIEENLAAVALEAKSEKAQKPKKKQAKVSAKEVIEPVEEETPVVAAKPKPKKAKKEKKPKADKSEAVLEDEAEPVAKVKRGKKGKKEAADS
jgi:nucleolar protein 15